MSLRGIEDSYVDCFDCVDCCDVFLLFNNQCIVTLFVASPSRIRWGVLLGKLCNYWNNLWDGCGKMCCKSDLELDFSLFITYCLDFYVEISNHHEPAEELFRHGKADGQPMQYTLRLLLLP